MGDRSERDDRVAEREAAEHRSQPTDVGAPPDVGRVARGPDEGPARDGGSGLRDDEEAAADAVGGGD